MRTLLVIILAAGLSFQCLVQLGITGWYEFNKSTVTKMFCINKDKPQLQCHGKCHLKKQLKKAGEEQSKDKEHKQAEWSTFLVPVSLLPAACKHFIEPAGWFVASQHDYAFHFPHTVFHPPRNI